MVENGIKTVSRIRKVVNPLDESEVGSILDEDYYGTFSLDDRKIYVTHEVTIEPGMYQFTIDRREGYVLRPLSIKTDKNIDMEVTNGLIDKTKHFLTRSHIYEERGLFCRRATLLYGSPGCGKTHSINTAVSQLVDANTLSLSIASDQVSIASLLNFFESHEKPDTVNKVFITIEDLGGGEVEPGTVKTVDSSVLSFLDGTKGAWNVPTIIFATTNYPENFLANLIDRPGRFDEVVEVPPPKTEVISFYMESLLGRKLDDVEIASFVPGMSLAHAKEAVIRHLVYDIPIASYFLELKQHKKNINNDFKKNSNRMGFQDGE